MAHNLTSHPPNQSTLPNQSTPDPRIAACKAEGGKWNGKECIMPGEEFEAREAIRTDPANIKERETRVAELGSGLRSEAQAKKEQRLKVGGVEELAEQQAVERQEAETQQRIAELRDERTPQRVELDPIVSQGGDIPVIGPFLAGLQRGLHNQKGKRFDSPILRSLIDKILGSDEPADLVFHGEQLRTVALEKIRADAIAEGLSDSEKFGALVEAFPATSLIKGASDAELPSDNVREILKQVRIFKSTAIDIELKFNKGTYDKATATTLIDGIEQDILKAETEILVLVQGSPDFQFNSDGVNFIELKLLEARRRLFDSLVTVEGGISTDPTEADILLALEEDFDIPE